MDTPTSPSLPAEPKRRGRPIGGPRRRKGDDGNLIWKIYQDEIGQEAKDQFRALLEEKEVPYITFLGHTMKGRRLDSLPAKHLLLYSQFFYVATGAKYDLNREALKEEKALGPRPARVHHPRQKAAEAQ